MSRMRAPVADVDVDVEGQGLGDDPLAGDPLLQTLYGVPVTTVRTAPKKKRKLKAKPKGRQPLADGKTFRLVTFSFYESDVQRLDALLADARRRGHSRVSRSQIVRLALRQVRLDELPESI